MLRLRDSRRTSISAPQQHRNPQPESIARNRYYTAAPIFANGLKDPLPRRSGFWKGLSDVVTFPPVAVEPPRSNDNAPPTWTVEQSVDAEKVRAALTVIPADGYAAWFRIGGALWSCVRKGDFSESTG